ncbi:MAG: hypothetical protein Q8O25_09830 [Sulfurisoma sp.]|nr:hypothetical protein [Sulfurisoma sp.]
MNALASLRQAGAVRLDAEESAALAAAPQGIPGEAWPFGSRVEPLHCGGDVDAIAPPAYY